jgi:hypothetical protein
MGLSVNLSWRKGSLTEDPTAEGAFATLLSGVGDNDATRDKAMEGEREDRDGIEEWPSLEKPDCHGGSEAERSRAARRGWARRWFCVTFSYFSLYHQGGKYQHGTYIMKTAIERPPDPLKTDFTSSSRQISSIQSVLNSMSKDSCLWSRRYLPRTNRATSMPQCDLNYTNQQDIRRI